MNIKMKDPITVFRTCCFFLVALILPGGCSSGGSKAESKDADIGDSGVELSDGGNQDRLDAHEGTQVDSGEQTTHCEEGETRPCFPGDPEQAGVGICVMGTQVCEVVMEGEFSVTEWGPCEDAGEPREEECNGLDDNCNGETDDGAQCPGNQNCLDGACCEPVDGGWSDWVDDLSGCAELWCGTYTKHRTCDNPPPSCGGEVCQGGDTMIENCPTGKNLVHGGGEDACNSSLQQMIADCEAMGCTWSGPTACTIGGSPSNPDAWGATGDCL